MIHASCPSCGSPVAFPHGAALTVVCAACQACVVREGDVLRDHGRIARFQRDLSPIQLDARGTYERRSFRVAGVLRKARKRVRWNEWYVVYDDGGDGWLGEGNGQWFLFGERVPLPDAPRLAGGARRRVELAGRRWRVMEDAEVAVVAAEGALPFALHPGEPARYLDLREEQGLGVATLDFADDPPVLWVGRDVTLLQLQMEGLRAFAGWSDPALVHFAGPEVTAVRALRCPHCGAPLELRAPGQAPVTACAFCGSTMGVDADGDLAVAHLLQRSVRPPFTPTLDLGARGKLEGVDWQVIGAMVRFVRDGDGEWPWTEYLLHNPYRGFCWLVEDGQGHWSQVEMLRGAPPTEGKHRVTWRGRTFRFFQAGNAYVKHVLGEFTWEVAAGDSAKTRDYVDPPTMLSWESSEGEVTWAVGTWLEAAEVGRAFGKALPRGRGIAPHQPNPFRSAGARARAAVRSLFLIGGASILLVAAFQLPKNEAIFEGRFKVESGENVWITEPFTVPGSGDETVSVRVSPDLPSYPDLQLSLIHTGTGEVWDWTTYGAATAVASLPAGSYTGRLALPAAATQDVGHTVTLHVVHDPGWKTPAVLLFLFTLLAPAAWLFDVHSFETRRWANAGG